MAQQLIELGPRRGRNRVKDGPVRPDAQAAAADDDGVGVGLECLGNLLERPGLEDVVRVEPAEHVAGRVIETNRQSVGLPAVLFDRNLVAQPSMGDQPLPRSVRRSTVANQVLHVHYALLAGNRFDRPGEPRHPVQNRRHDRDAHCVPCTNVEVLNCTGPLSLRSHGRISVAQRDLLCYWVLSRRLAYVSASPASSRVLGAQPSS